MQTQPNSVVQSTIIGAIAGDLVGSRSASDESVHSSIEALKRAATEIGKLHKFDARFTRYRGDGWQMCFPKPERALYFALTLTAALKAADTGLETRLAVGIGPAVSLGTRDLSDAAGPVFVSAGDLLENMASHERMKIIGTGITEWQQAVFSMADWIAQGWTAQQAEALMMRNLMVGNNNSQRARKLGISRQAFEARLKGSGIVAINPALAAFSAYDFRAHDDA